MESSCFNNPMLLDTLMSRQNPAQYQGICSGVLEAKHYGIFLNKLCIDYIPDIPMNLLSLSQLSRQTQWQVRYEHEQSEFVLRTTAGHKLIFTLYNNFYVCDMATSIFRSHRARVKDAVELFTNSYQNCPAWLLTARLEKIKDTSKVLDIVNTDFPHLENRISMLENRDWCGEHINVLEIAILHRVSVHHDISNHNDLKNIQKTKSMI